MRIFYKNYLFYLTKEMTDDSYTIYEYRAILKTSLILIILVFLFDIILIPIYLIYGVRITKQNQEKANVSFLSSEDLSFSYIKIKNELGFHYKKQGYLGKIKLLK